MVICPECSHAFPGPGWLCPHCGHEPPLSGGVRRLVGDDSRLAMDFPDSHEILSQVEGDSFWFRHRLRVITAAVRRHFPQAGSFLEVGCGNGQVIGGLARSLPDLRCVGLDLGLEALERARRDVSQLEVVHADARCLPYRDEFDLAGAFDVLEHLNDDEQILANLHQALRPGGGLVVSVPQHQWLWSSFDELVCHKRRYHGAGLRRKLEAQGFTVMWMSSFMTLVMPVVLASRLKWLLSREEPSLQRVKADLDLSPRLDTMLYALCGLEDFFLRREMALPFGSSLLCLARKEG